MCADAVDVLAIKPVMALLDIPAIFFRSPQRLLFHEGDERIKRSTTRSDMAAR